uniref:Fork-head domain-containing protein n=1 Tax=Anopheles atroparvus TaxID=41427 RepID=A0AAG5DCY5_ANOAO
MQQQQLHMNHQPTSQQQPPSCPSSPRPSATPTTVSSPSHPVPTSQHHNNNQPPVGHQYVPQQYAAGDAGSPYGNNTGNNQSGGSWPNPTAPADGATVVACSATSADGGAGGSSTSISPRMEPSSGGLTNATQTPDTPEDCKNLSWLLNFKLDDIPNLSPRSNRKQRSKSNATGGGGGQGGPGTGPDGAAGGNASVGGDHGAVAIEEGDLNVGENVTIESSSGKSPKKPPFTYTELIEYALEEQGDLTVAAIYQWISDHFPYYKSHDDRWKNSVRHNLSINPHFRKGRKSSHGSGHLWTISSRNSEDNFLAWEHKKQRFEWFFKMEANARVRELSTADSMTDDEVAAATASLAQYVPKSPTAGSGSSPACQSLDAMNPVASEQNHHLPAQTLQQHQQQHQQQPQQQQHHQTQQQIAATYHQTQTLYADIITTAQFEVTTTAEEIGKHPDEDTLNGLRRGTEIQIVRPAQTIQTYEMLDTEYSIADYLNPVPKEEIVQECGLRSVALDPAELGINIPSATGQDEDILFDDFNLNYFGNNIMT